MLSTLNIKIQNISMLTRYLYNRMCTCTADYVPVQQNMYLYNCQLIPVPLFCSLYSLKTFQ